MDIYNVSINNSNQPTNMKWRIIQQIHVQKRENLTLFFHIKFHWQIVIHNGGYLAL